MRPGASPHMIMDTYFLIKTLHIISATILFGTGIGTAFFMFSSWFAPDLHSRMFAARMTVLADFIFTTPAVLIQPLTGLWLIQHGGFSWQDPWLLWTYGLYILAGLCWLPVVWIQIQLKKMLMIALTTQTTLPASYARLFKIWFILGWPAFGALIVIFYLMVAKPA